MRRLGWILLWVTVFLAMATHALASSPLRLECDATPYFSYIPESNADGDRFWRAALYGESRVNLRLINEAEEAASFRCAVPVSLCDASGRCLLRAGLFDGVFGEERTGRARRSIF